MSVLRTFKIRGLTTAYLYTFTRIHRAMFIIYYDSVARTCRRRRRRRLLSRRNCAR